MTDCASEIRLVHSRRNCAIPARLQSGYQTIHDTGDLVAIAWRGSPDGPAVVTFGTRDSPPRDEFFAGDLLRRLNVSHVCIAARRNHWWQTPEMPGLIDRLGDFLGRAHPDLRVYGASMGAFGAMAFAAALRARSVLTIAPAFTLDTHRDAR